MMKEVGGNRIFEKSDDSLCEERRLRDTQNLKCEDRRFQKYLALKTEDLLSKPTKPDDRRSAFLTGKIFKCD